MQDIVGADDALPRSPFAWRDACQGVRVTGSWHLSAVTMVSALDGCVLDDPLPCAARSAGRSYLCGAIDFPDAPRERCLRAF
jgi:hypothetical protein